MKTVRDCKHITRHPLKLSTDGIMITPCCISILEIVESWVGVCYFSQDGKQMPRRKITTRTRNFPYYKIDFIQSFACLSGWLGMRYLENFCYVDLTTQHLPPTNTSPIYPFRHCSWEYEMDGTRFARRTSS